MSQHERRWVEPFEPAHRSTSPSSQPLPVRGPRNVYLANVDVEAERGGLRVGGLVGSRQGGQRAPDRAGAESARACGAFAPTDPIDYAGDGVPARLAAIEDQLHEITECLDEIQRAIREK
jgi:hypothetical protein